MPKAPMDEKQFLEKKERIIDIAAEIVMEDGFQYLSMRKIGTRIGMTAANLYNYYANKDELYIAIRSRAGKILYETLFKAYSAGNTIIEKMRLMSEAYLLFGTSQSNYYSILFDMSTPKFADYVDSPLEKQAKAEKESTEQSVELMQRCINDLKAEGYRLPDHDNAFWITIWSQLHGLISLYNNRLIPEVTDAPEETMKASARMAIEMTFSYIGLADPGRRS